MKLPVLRLTFRFALLGAVALPLVARPALAQPEAKSGYELLLAAAALTQPGDRKNNGTPSTLDTDLTPEENLRRQRLAVARNAPALALLRQALQKPIELPLKRRFDDSTYSPFSRFREMTRQLIQESDVRLADDDVAGALDSRLTMFDFGAAITRGAPVIDSLVGIAIEEMGRKTFAKVVVRLDAPQIRATLMRLHAIDARRASFGEVLEAQKQLDIYLISNDLRAFAEDEAKQQKVGKHSKSPFKSIIDADIQDALKLSQSDVSAQISTFFDALIARSLMSYQRALKAEVPDAPNALIRMDIDYYGTLPARFNYERNIVHSRQIEGALDLRAIKLETGAYPLTYTAPIDPFSDNQPLICHRDGDSYQLYSVGPDGHDDGGAPIQTVHVDKGTGERTTGTYLWFDSTGDIMAPVF